MWKLKLESRLPLSRRTFPRPHSLPPKNNLRISSEPMNVLAAEAQARFADEASSQPNQGALIHSIPNAMSPAAPPIATTVQANSPAPLPAAQATAASSPNATPAQADATIPTTSARDQQINSLRSRRLHRCANRALCAGRSFRRLLRAAAAILAVAPTTRATTTAHLACPIIRLPDHRALLPARQARANPRACQTQAPAQILSARIQTPPSQTLGNAPIGAPPENAPSAAAFQMQPTPSESAGASDQELQQQNLPPLRGPWIRIQRQATPPSPRDLAEQQLQAIESGYSGWLGGTSLLNYRTGAPGYAQLAAIEAPFEASAPLGYHARITAIARPVFLDSGQADGTATISVLESTIPGPALIAIPEPIGTLTATSTHPARAAKRRRHRRRIAARLPALAIAGGYTPYNFLVSTFTGRFHVEPGNGGPFTFILVRDSVKDSQLSYAGLRDPAGNTLGTLRDKSGAESFTTRAQCSLPTATRSPASISPPAASTLPATTSRATIASMATGGAYWRVLTSPEYGNLSIGANFFAMHYANNQNAFTHGMGGYFSPQGYFLANVPFTLVGPLPDQLALQHHGRARRAGLSGRPDAALAAGRRQVA